MLGNNNKKKKKTKNEKSIYIEDLVHHVGSDS